MLIPWLDTPHNIVCDRINGLSGYYAKQCNAKFCYRRTPEGLRVWRLS